MKNEVLKRFLLLTFSAAAACALFYVCFRYLLWWSLPFLSAFLIAQLCEPIVLYLRERLHFCRAFSAALLTLVMLFLLGGLFSLLLSALLREARSLLESLPALAAGMPALFDRLIQRIAGSSLPLPQALLSALRDRLMHTFSDAGAVFALFSDRLLAALTSAAAALPQIILAAAVTVLAVFFTLTAYPTLCARCRELLPPASRDRIRLLRGGVMRSLGHWLRAELTLLCVTFGELLLGFLLLRQNYALLLAFAVSLLDALPVFGTGTVLIPWALWLLVQNRLPRALAFLALYLVTLLVRNILEPGLLASRAGLPSVVSLYAMYLGFCTFGVGGMVLFPFLLLTVRLVRSKA